MIACRTPSSSGLEGVLASRAISNKVSVLKLNGFFVFEAEDGNECNSN